MAIYFGVKCSLAQIQKPSKHPYAHHMKTCFVHKIITTMQLKVHEQGSKEKNAVHNVQE
jgi:hypothetical protein